LDLLCKCGFESRPGTKDAVFLKWRAGNNARPLTDNMIKELDAARKDVVAFCRTLDFPEICHVPSVLSAVSSLEKGHASKLWLTAMETMSLYLQNILEHPEDGKYRHINPNNAAFKKRLGNLSVGMTMLVACGFREGEDGSLSCARDVNLTHLRAKQVEFDAAVRFLRKKLDFASPATTVGGTGQDTKSTSAGGGSSSQAAGTAGGSDRSATTTTHPQSVGGSTAGGGQENLAILELQRQHDEQMAAMKSEIAMLQHRVHKKLPPGTAATLTRAPPYLQKRVQKMARTMGLNPREIEAAIDGKRDQQRYNSATHAAAKRGPGVVETFSSSFAPSLARNQKGGYQSAAVVDHTRPSTTLSSAASAGDTAIYVNDYSGFKAGLKIRIGKGRTAEERFVIGLGSLLLDFPLQFTHRQDEPIVCLKVPKDEFKAFQRSQAVLFIRNEILLPLVYSAVSIAAVKIRTTGVQKHFENRLVLKPCIHALKLHEQEIDLTPSAAAEASPFQRQGYRLALLPRVGQTFVSGPSPFTRKVLCLQDSLPMAHLYHLFGVLAHANSDGDAHSGGGQRGRRRQDSRDSTVSAQQLQRALGKDRSLQCLFRRSALDHAAAIGARTDGSEVPVLSFLDVLDMTSSFEGIATKSGHLDAELAPVFHLYGDDYGCLPVHFVADAISQLGIFFPPSLTLADVIQKVEEYREPALAPSQFAELLAPCRSCLQLLRMVRVEYEAAGNEDMVALNGDRSQPKSRFLAGLKTKPEVSELAFYDFKCLPPKRGYTVIQVLEAGVPKLCEWVSWHQIVCAICFAGLNSAVATSADTPRHCVQQVPHESWAQSVANDCSGTLLLKDDASSDRNSGFVDVFQVTACAESSTLAVLLVNGRVLLFDNLSDSVVFSKQLITYEPVPSVSGDKEEDFLAWCVSEDMDDLSANAPGSQKSRVFAAIFLSLVCNLTSQIVRISNPRRSSFLMLNTTAADACIRFHEFGSGRRLSRLRIHIPALRPCVAGFDADAGGEEHRLQQKRSSEADAIGVEQFMILEDMNLLVCTVHGNPVIFVVSLCSGEIVTKLVGHTGIISPCLLHIDSKKMLLSGSPAASDSTVRLWDIHTQLSVNIACSRDPACQNTRVDNARLRLRVNQRLLACLDSKNAPCHGEWLFGEIQHVYKKPQPFPWQSHNGIGNNVGSGLPVYEVRFEDGSFTCYAKGTDLKQVPKGRVFLGPAELNLSTVNGGLVVGETVAKWKVNRRDYVASLFQQYDREGTGLLTSEDFEAVLKRILSGNGDLVRAGGKSAETASPEDGALLAEDVGHISKLCASYTEPGMASYAPFLDLLLPEETFVPEVARAERERAGGASARGCDTFCKRVVRFPTTTADDRTACHGVLSLAYLETASLIAVACGDGSVTLLDPSSSPQCLSHPLRTFYLKRAAAGRGRGSAAAAARVEWTTNGMPFSPVLRLGLAKSSATTTRRQHPQQRVTCLDMQSSVMLTKAAARPELVVTNTLVELCDAMLAKNAATVVNMNTKTLIGGFVYLLFDGTLLHLPTPNGVFHKELVELDLSEAAGDFEAAACAPPFSQLTTQLSKLREICRRRFEIVRAAFCVSTEYPNLQSVVHVFNEKEVLQKAKGHQGAAGGQLMSHVGVEFVVFCRKGDDPSFDIASMTKVLARQSSVASGSGSAFASSPRKCIEKGVVVHDYEDGTFEVAFEARNRKSRVHSNRILPNGAAGNAMTTAGGGAVGIPETKVFVKEVQLGSFVNVVCTSSPVAGAEGGQHVVDQSTPRHKIDVLVCLVRDVGGDGKSATRHAPRSAARVLSWTIGRTNMRSAIKAYDSKFGASATAKFASVFVNFSFHSLQRSRCHLLENLQRKAQLRQRYVNSVRNFGEAARNAIMKSGGDVAVQQGFVKDAFEIARTNPVRQRVINPTVLKVWDTIFREMLWEKRQQLGPSAAAGAGGKVDMNALAARVRSNFAWNFSVGGMLDCILQDASGVQMFERHQKHTITWDTLTDFAEFTFGKTVCLGQALNLLERGQFSVCELMTAFSAKTKGRRLSSITLDDFGLLLQGADPTVLTTTFAFEGDSGQRRGGKPPAGNSGGNALSLTFAPETQSQFSSLLWSNEWARQFGLLVGMAREVAGGIEQRCFDVTSLFSRRALLRNTKLHRGKVGRKYASFTNPHRSKKLTVMYTSDTSPFRIGGKAVLSGWAMVVRDGGAGGGNDKDGMPVSVLHSTIPTRSYNRASRTNEAHFLKVCGDHPFVLQLFHHVNLDTIAEGLVHTPLVVESLEHWVPLHVLLETRGAMVKSFHLDLVRTIGLQVLEGLHHVHANGVRLRGGLNAHGVWVSHSETSEANGGRSRVVVKLVDFSSSCSVNRRGGATAAGSRTEAETAGSASTDFPSSPSEDDDMVLFGLLLMEMLCPALAQRHGIASWHELLQLMPVSLENELDARPRFTARLPEEQIANFLQRTRPYQNPAGCDTDEEVATAAAARASKVTAMLHFAVRCGRGFSPLFPHIEQANHRSKSFSAALQELEVPGVVSKVRKALRKTATSMRGKNSVVNRENFDRVLSFGAGADSGDGEVSGYVEDVAFLDHLNALLPAGVSLSESDKAHLISALSDGGMVKVHDAQTLLDAFHPNAMFENAVFDVVALCVQGHNPDRDDQNSARLPALSTDDLLCHPYFLNVGSNTGGATVVNHSSASYLNVNNFDYENIVQHLFAGPLERILKAQWTCCASFGGNATAAPRVRRTLIAAWREFVLVLDAFKECCCPLKPNQHDKQYSPDVGILLKGSSLVQDDGGPVRCNWAMMMTHIMQAGVLPCLVACACRFYDCGQYHFRGTTNGDKAMFQQTTLTKMVGIFECLFHQCDLAAAAENPHGSDDDTEVGSIALEVDIGGSVAVGASAAAAAGPSVAVSPEGGVHLRPFIPTVMGACVALLSGNRGSGMIHQPTMQGLHDGASANRRRKGGPRLWHLLHRFKWQAPSLGASDWALQAPQWFGDLVKQVTALTSDFGGRYPWIDKYARLLCETTSGGEVVQQGVPGNYFTYEHHALESWLYWLEHGSRSEGGVRANDRLSMTMTMDQRLRCSLLHAEAGGGWSAAASEARAAELNMVFFRSKSYFEALLVHMMSLGRMSSTSTHMSTTRSKRAGLTALEAQMRMTNIVEPATAGLSSKTTGSRANVNSAHNANANATTTLRELVAGLDMIQLFLDFRSCEKVVDLLSDNDQQTRRAALSIVAGAVSRIPELVRGNPIYAHPAHTELAMSFCNGRCLRGVAEQLRARDSWDDVGFLRLATSCLTSIVAGGDLYATQGWKDSGVIPVVLAITQYTTGDVRGGESTVTSHQSTPRTRAAAAVITAFWKMVEANMTPSLLDLIRTNTNASFVAKYNLGRRSAHLTDETLWSKIQDDASIFHISELPEYVVQIRLMLSDHFLNTPHVEFDDARRMSRSITSIMGWLWSHLKASLQFFQDEEGDHPQAAARVDAVSSVLSLIVWISGGVNLSDQHQERNKVTKQLLLVSKDGDHQGDREDAWADGTRRNTHNPNVLDILAASLALRPTFERYRPNALYGLWAQIMHILASVLGLVHGDTAEQDPIAIHFADHTMPLLSTTFVQSLRTSVTLTKAAIDGQMEHVHLADSYADGRFARQRLWKAMLAYLSALHEDPLFLKEAVAPLHAAVGSILCEMLRNTAWISVTAHSCPPSFAKFHHSFVVRDEATDLMNALAGHGDGGGSRSAARGGGGVGGGDRMHLSIPGSMVTAVNAMIAKEEVISAEITRVQRLTADLGKDPAYTRHFLNSTVRFFRCLVRLQSGHHGPVLDTLFRLGVPSDVLHSGHRTASSSLVPFSWRDWLQDGQTLLDMQQSKAQAQDLVRDQAMARPTRAATVTTSGLRTADTARSSRMMSRDDDDVLSLPDEIAAKRQQHSAAAGGKGGSHGKVKKKKHATWAWEKDLLVPTKMTTLPTRYGAVVAGAVAAQGRDVTADDGSGVQLRLSQSRLGDVLEGLGDDVANIKLAFDRRSQGEPWDDERTLSQKDFRLFLLDLGFEMTDGRVRRLIESLKKEHFESLTWPTVLKLLDTFLKNDGSVATVRSRRKETQTKPAIDDLSLSMGSIGYLRGDGGGGGRGGEGERRRGGEGGRDGRRMPRDRRDPGRYDDDDDHERVGGGSSDVENEKPAAPRQLSGAERAQIRKVFDMYDVNGDGVITYKDLRSTFEKQGRRMNETELRAWIRSRDTAGGGHVSFADFCKSLEK
jgi:Ca2+-binding EF-hand superfamily protein/WD40 repeat protein